MSRPDYALQKILKNLEGKHPLYEGLRASWDYLRTCPRTELAWERLHREYESGDFIFFPAQFGYLYRGHSPRRADEKFGGNEFGLDTYTVACMLMTHPERLNLTPEKIDVQELSVVCLGDIYRDRIDTDFVEHPYFYNNTGQLKLMPIHKSRFDGGAYPPASASGFVV